ncbi:MAG: cyanophycinase [Gemmataceae bacterium]|nr:cyanophycinase [Gemmataceae bacterium]
MAAKKQGTLVVIGGHEDREGEMAILREVARRVGSGPLVVTAVASEEPEGLFEEYEKAFRKLGVERVADLAIGERAEARTEEAARTVDEAAGVFFTGGDQLRITSQIGGTPVFHALRRLLERGGVIAGTSAGASVVCSTMMVSGSGDESARVGEVAKMAPGLGFLPGVIVDQHFAERGRMGRLLSAVAQNPASLGVGIDEDTAIVVEGNRFSALGAGAVYVLDGSTVTASNIAEAEAERPLSIFDVRLHVLSQGDEFDLGKRQAAKRPQDG